MAKTLNIVGSKFEEKVSICLNNEDFPTKDITLNLRPPASGFQGRNDTFAAIQQKFTTNKVIVLHGMPGIGKTETARNFANRNCEFYNNNLIWIYSETPNNIEQCFDILAKTLKLQTTDVSQIYFRFKTSRALFTFDNVENMSSIKNFLPPSQVQSNIDILITSRLSTWDSTISTIPLDSLKIDDALDIFKAKLGDKFQEYSIEIWTKLVKQLDGIPLCLQIVSSLIYQQLRGIRLTKFNLEEFFNELKETFIHSTIPETEQNYYNKTVLSSIYSALNQLKKEEAEFSIDLLCWVAYLDPDRINEEDLLECPSMKKSKKLLGKALSKLVDYSLIHATSLSGQIRMQVHRTVQLVLREYDLRMNNGQMFISVLKLLPVHHTPSIFKCVKKKEYEPVVLDVCKKDDFPFYEFVLDSSYFHCDEILNKIFPIIKAKYQDAETYASIVNKMLYSAIRNRHTDLNTIHLLINHGATITNKKDFIRAACSWFSTDILDIVLQLNSRDHLSFKRLLLNEIDHLSFLNAKKVNDCKNHLIHKKN